MYICDKILRGSKHQSNIWPYLSYVLATRPAHLVSLYFIALLILYKGHMKFLVLH